MAETLSMPNATPAPAPAKAAKVKTVRLKLKHDIWIDDGTGTGGTIRLETNVKKLDANGQPIFDMKKGDFERELLEHDVPLDVAKKLLEEEKAIRMDKLPGEDE